MPVWCFTVFCPGLTNGRTRVSRRLRRWFGLSADRWPAFDLTRLPLLDHFAAEPRHGVERHGDLHRVQDVHDRPIRRALPPQRRDALFELHQLVILGRTARRVVGRRLCNAVLTFLRIVAVAHRTVFGNASDESC